MLDRSAHAGPIAHKLGSLVKLGDHASIESERIAVLFPRFPFVYFVYFVYFVVHSDRQYRPALRPATEPKTGSVRDR